MVSVNRACLEYHHTLLFRDVTKVLCRPPSRVTVSSMKRSLQRFHAGGHNRIAVFPLHGNIKQVWIRSSDAMSMSRQTIAHPVSSEDCCQKPRAISSFDSRGNMPDEKSKDNKVSPFFAQDHVYFDLEQQTHASLKDGRDAHSPHRRSQTKFQNDFDKGARTSATSNRATNGSQVSIQSCQDIDATTSHRSGRSNQSATHATSDSAQYSSACLERWLTQTPREDPWNPYRASRS